MEGDVNRNEWPTLEEEIAAAVLAEGVTDPGHKFLAVEVDNVAPVYTLSDFEERREVCASCGDANTDLHDNDGTLYCQSHCPVCEHGDWDSL